MARSRIIKPGFFSNEDLGALAPLTRLLFAGIWTIADRAGRLEDRPAKIKAAILPYDQCDGEEMISRLASGGFLLRYEVGGKRYLQVVNWTVHQQPHVKEAVSTIPAPEEHGTSTVQAPDMQGASTVLAPEEHGTSTEDARLVTSYSLPVKENPPVANATSPRKRVANVLDEEPQGFAEFYAAYPRHDARLPAAKAYTRLSAIERERAMTALPAWKACPQWQDVQYIPQASTYLNERRFNDDPPRASPNGNGHKPVDRATDSERFGTRTIRRATGFGAPS